MSRDTCNSLELLAVDAARCRSAEYRQSPGRQLVRQVRISRHLPRVVLHFHHDDRSQHHLWHHRRHVLRAQRPQGRVSSLGVSLSAFHTCRRELCSCLMFA